MTISAFGNLDEMFAVIDEHNRKAREEADNLRSFLDKFKVAGTCLMMVHPEGFLIFGRVEHSEYPEDQERMEDSFANGYVLCRAYSELCPGGEVGDIHIAHIGAIISQEGFEFAQATQWQASPDLLSFVQYQNPNQGFH